MQIYGLGGTGEKQPAGRLPAHGPSAQGQDPGPVFPDGKILLQGGELRLAESLFTVAEQIGDAPSLPFRHKLVEVGKTRAEHICKALSDTAFAASHEAEQAHRSEISRHTMDKFHKKFSILQSVLTVKSK